MKMPAIYIIDNTGLNAYASDINHQTYSITLTKGIIAKLDNEELSGVIAHELTHIRNRNTHLLIISVIFVGIMAVIMDITIRIF